MNTSYLTVDEYKRAPTSIDTSTLDYFSGTSDAAAQDAELANVIARASAWIDNYCELHDGLYASVNTETIPTHLTKDGYLRIRPYNIPIIKLVSVQWKVWPRMSFETVDPNDIQVYERFFETMLWFPYFNGPTLTIGASYAYPLSSPYTPYLDPSAAAKMADMQITAQYTYINGYPNTTLSADVALGSQTLTVDDTTGMLSGTVLTLYDGSNTEKITLSADPVNNTVQLVSPLLFAHKKGVAVSAIPADVKQACILMTNYLIKERGVNSITMEGTTNPLMQKYDDIRDVEIAQSMLNKYKRVV